jgi:p-cumate 2,3-dioxygenase beta subunit
LESKYQLQREVEDLLYYEAELLDSWRLPEWLELFTQDARYLVPTPGLPADASPDECLFLINDDRLRLGGRVNRLGRRTAHAEYPHSTTLHLVSNVRLEEGTPDSQVVHAAFYTSRIKDGVTDVFVGRLRYLLTRQDGLLRIREKRCNLHIEALVPQGRVSFIL